MLIVALFLPWAGVQSINRTGWELNTVGDVLFLVVGLFAIATAITGGQFGLFRPDLSLIGATDLLGVTATLLIAWLIVLDFPEHASREPAIFVALISAAAIAGAVVDYRPLRGALMFPPSKPANRAARVSQSSSNSPTLYALGATTT